MRVFQNLESSKTIALPPGDFNAAPAAPTGLSATVEGGQASLSWTDSSGNETSFVIERSVDGGAFASLPSPVAAGSTSFTDTTLVEGSSYSYRVRASNDFGDSAYASSVIVTAPKISATIGSMMSVQGGSFNNSVSMVTVSSFYMSRCEITQAQYAAVTLSSPSYFTGDTNRPVEQVTWYDAVEFCNKLSAMEGLTPVYAIGARTPASGYPITGATVTVNWSANGFRLPTEAEWEFAARGGNMTHNYTYAGSDTIDDVAWYASNSGSTTHAVGGKSADELGLRDMSGNALEWCWDWQASYPSAAQSDPTGPGAGSSHILRGGSWALDSAGCRTDFRGAETPDFYSWSIGFRVVRSAATDAAQPAAPWARRYSGPYWDRAYAGIPSLDGGFALGGVTVGLPGGSAHAGAALMKFRADLSIEWQYAFHSEKDGDYIYGMARSSDGGYICSGLTGAGADTYSGLIMKIDGSGSVVWKKCIDGGNEDYLYQVLALSDGSYVACGRTKSLMPTTIDTASWLLRFAEDGTILWQRAFADASFDYASTIAETLDGKIMMAGLRSSTGPGSQNDTLVMKIDMDGTPLWRKTYDEGGRDDGAKGIIRSSDGNFLVESMSSGGTDFWILKIDPEGNPLWAKTISGGQNDYYDDLFLPCQSSDGGFVIPSYTTSFGAGGRDASVIKLGSTGTLDWAMTYGGGGDEIARTVLPYAGDGYLVAGQADGAVPGDLLAMKIGLDGTCGTYGSSRAASSLDAPATVTNRSIVDGVGGFHAYTPAFAATDPALTRLDMNAATVQIFP